MATTKAIAHRRWVARQRASDARNRRGKRERWLAHSEASGERRFLKFRPYHVERDGKHRLGAYGVAHCRQAVRDAETIEAFFHAQRMRAAGYYFSRGLGASVGGRWVRL